MRSLEELKVDLLICKEQDKLQAQFPKWPHALERSRLAPLNIVQAAGPAISVRVCVVQVVGAEAPKTPTP